MKVLISMREDILSRNQRILFRFNMQAQDACMIDTPDNPIPPKLNGISANTIIFDDINKDDDELQSITGMKNEQS